MTTPTRDSQADLERPYLSFAGPEEDDENDELAELDDEELNDEWLDDESDDEEDFEDLDDLEDEEDLDDEDI